LLACSDEDDNTTQENIQSIETYTDIFRRIVSTEMIDRSIGYEIELSINKLCCHASSKETFDFQRELFLLLSARVKYSNCNQKITSMYANLSVRANEYLHELFEQASDIGDTDERTLQRLVELCAFCCECTSKISKTIEQVNKYIELPTFSIDVSIDSLEQLIRQGKGFGLTRAKFEKNAFYYCQYIQAENDELQCLIKCLEDIERQQNQLYTSLTNTIANIISFRITEWPSNALYLFAITQSNPVTWILLNIQLPSGLYSAIEMIQLFNMNAPDGFTLTYDSVRMCFTIMCTSYIGIYVYDPLLDGKPSIGTLLNLASAINEDFNPEDINNYATSITGFCNKI
jgi:hypothetical protein